MPPAAELVNTSVEAVLNVNTWKGRLGSCVLLGRTDWIESGNICPPVRMIYFAVMYLSCSGRTQWLRKMWLEVPTPVTFSGACKDDNLNMAFDMYFLPAQLLLLLASLKSSFLSQLIDSRTHRQRKQHERKKRRNSFL